MKRSYLLILLFLFATGFPATFVPQSTNRVNLNFNQNWKFYLGDVSGAQATTFSDASWQTVNLPHSVRLEPKYCSSIGIYEGSAGTGNHFPSTASIRAGKCLSNFRRPCRPRQFT
jgi:hypothetical protein